MTYQERDADDRIARRQEQAESEYSRYWLGEEPGTHGASKWAADELRAIVEEMDNCYPEEGSMLGSWLGRIDAIAGKLAPK